MKTECARCGHLRWEHGLNGKCTVLDYPAACPCNSFLPYVRPGHDEWSPWKGVFKRFKKEEPEIAQDGDPTVGAWKVVDETGTHYMLYPMEVKAPYEMGPAWLRFRFVVRLR